MCLVPRANNYLPHFPTDSGLPVKVVYEKKRVLNGTKKRKGSSTTALINVNPQTHNRSERPITSKENNSFLFRQIIMLKFAHFKQITYPPLSIFNPRVCFLFISFNTILNPDRISGFKIFMSL
jgi:hypothetical protein